MQVEVIKFLLEANTYFQGAGHAVGPNDDAQLEDLQAVDRVLPDPDWFELDEQLEQEREAVDALFRETKPALEF